MLEYLANFFSTREMATIFWILVIVIYCLINPKIRKSLKIAVKSFFVKQLFIPFLMMTFYVSCVTFLFYYFDLWNVILLKDTIIWFFSYALILFVNINKANNISYFKDVFKDNLKVILILEFLLNFYTSNFWSELLIIPLLTFIVILQMVAENSGNTNPEHKKVSQLMNIIIAIFGFYVLYYVTKETFDDYKGLLTINSFETFLLPIVYSIITIPYFYFLALYVKYEILFIRFPFMYKDKTTIKRLKWYILLYANINLNKINRINKNLDYDLISDNVKKHIRNIAKAQ